MCDVQFSNIPHARVKSGGKKSPFILAFLNKTLVKGLYYQNKLLTNCELMYNTCKIYNVYKSHLKNFIPHNNLYINIYVDL